MIRDARMQGSRAEAFHDRERKIEANEGREETEVSRGKNAAKEPRGADP